MIIIESMTGATNYVQRFECSASKLVFKVRAVAKADFEGVFATIVVVDKQGQQKVITPRANLRDLLEISASNEGLVQVKENYTSGAISSYDYLATLELSNFGAVDLGGGYAQIQLDNCVTTTSWNIYGLDNANLTSMIIKYEPLWNAADQYKQVDLTDCYAVALPKANLIDVQLQFVNGRTIIYKPTELDAIVQEINELAEVEQNVANNGSSAIMVGSNKLYCIGVKNCVGMRVQYSQPTTFYKISDSILQ